MVANELTFAVLTLVVLLAIAFYTMYRKTGAVTVGAIDLYLCLHNLKYIILLRLSPSFHLLSILFDTPPIILLLVVVFIGWWYVKNNVGRIDDNKFQALKKLAEMERLGTIDQAPIPSWALEAYSNQQDFVALLVLDTRRKNIPDSFLLDTWNNKDSRKLFFNLAGVLEEKNSSFREQSMAVADLIIHNWSKTSTADQQIFINDERRIET